MSTDDACAMSGESLLMLMRWGIRWRCRLQTLEQYGWFSLPE